MCPLKTNNQNQFTILLRKQSCLTAHLWISIMKRHSSVIYSLFSLWWSVYLHVPQWITAYQPNTPLLQFHCLSRKQVNQYHWHEQVWGKRCDQPWLATLEVCACATAFDRTVMLKQGQCIYLTKKEKEKKLIRNVKSVLMGGEERKLMSPRYVGM